MAGYLGDNVLMAIDRLAKDWAKWDADRQANPDKPKATIPADAPLHELVKWARGRQEQIDALRSQGGR